MKYKYGLKFQQNLDGWGYETQHTGFANDIKTARQKGYDWVSTTSSRKRKSLMILDESMIHKGNAIVGEVGFYKGNICYFNEKTRDIYRLTPSGNLGEKVGHVGRA